LKLKGSFFSVTWSWSCIIGDLGDFEHVHRFIRSRLRIGKKLLGGRLLISSAARAAWNSIEEAPPLPEFLEWLP